MTKPKELSNQGDYDHKEYKYFPAEILKCLEEGFNAEDPMVTLCFSHDAFRTQWNSSQGLTLHQRQIKLIEFVEAQEMFPELLASIKKIISVNFSDLKTG